MHAKALRRFQIAAAFCLSLCAFPLHAHDIYSSWAESKLHADRLEITLTLARSCAHRLLPDAATLPPITPENFATFHARLQAAASRLFEIAAAEKLLALKSADVKISGDEDIVFTLTFPRPPSGPLRIFAAYLGHLVDGHVATLVLSNTAGDDLGWSPLSIDQPVFQIVLPAAVPPKPSSRAK